jgi:quinoprotein glucose dehydrogenase
MKQVRGPSRLSSAAALLAVVAAVGHASAQSWYRSGADNESTKFSPLVQIDRGNVAGLKPAWDFRSGHITEHSETVQTNPVFTGKLLVVTALDGRVIALHPALGHKVWEAKLPLPVARRGLTYAQGSLYVPAADGVYRLAADDGRVLRKYDAGVSYVPPVVDGNTLYAAELIGGLVAVDLSTGVVRWRRPLVKDDVHARVWSGFSYDPKHGLLFVVTGNAPSLSLAGETGFSNSVVAIRAADGGIAWHFKEIKSDVLDLDMVGAPVVATVRSGGVPTDVVIALSKTSNILLLERKTGRLLNTRVDQRQHGRVHSRFADPEPLQGLDFARSDLTSVSAESADYVAHQIRRASLDSAAEVPKYGSAVVYALHGGFEWPGGAFNPEAGVLFLPMNRQPWLIRSEPVSRNRTDNLQWLALSSYQKHCSRCHGINLSAKTGSEMRDGPIGHVPSLLAGTARFAQESYVSVDHFRAVHRFAEKEHALNRVQDAARSDTAFETLKKLAQRVLSRQFAGDVRRIEHFTSTELLAVYRELSDFDAKLKRDDALEERRSWQPLLDFHALPGSKPPWGELAAVDMNSRKVLWRVPFGFEQANGTANRHPGSRNFGGLLTTRTNLIFATGTTDEMARAYDALSGAELWAAKLPYAGSTQPATYQFENCQYVVFTATGGRFKGFRSAGDATVAYKLGSCR